MADEIDRMGTIHALRVMGVHDHHKREVVLAYWSLVTNFLRHNQYLAEDVLAGKKMDGSAEWGFQGVVRELGSKRKAGEFIRRYFGFREALHLRRTE